MNDHEDRERDDEVAGGDEAARDAKLRGVPYDWRRPTAERVKSRLFNRDDPRLFPPKAFGAGWTINFYWVVHPVAYRSARRAARSKS